jgi:hypothetical protein
MVLGSKKLALYSLEKSADCFAFAQLHSEGEKIYTVSDEAGLADGGLFRGRQSDNETTLL